MTYTIGMRKLTHFSISLCFIVLLQACHVQVTKDKTNEGPGSASSKYLSAHILADLPIAISNNAVAAANVEGDVRLYSFLGLEAGKEWTDVSKKAFRFVDGEWTQLSDVPVKQGRLASIAVTVNNQIYLFGGYTVAEDHSEVSTPEVLRFDPVVESYKRVADMPIPSDDAVAVVYQDRYIYLISGWHDKGNINLVQVYDVLTDTWKQATQFPGSPVFGHAGGIVANQIVVCDGVKIQYPQASPVSDNRKFLMSNECYQGLIDVKDAYRINWSVMQAHPQSARYRMAAVGDETNERIVFVGGSDNPYNYNGIGYNGDPSKAENSVFAYDLLNYAWQELGAVENPTMDHRGLLKYNDQFITVGGMDSNQNVLTKTHIIKIPSK